MKKRKTVVSEALFTVYSDEKIKISKLDKELFFEIGKEVTSDLAEAVVLMTSLFESNDKIWNLKLEVDEKKIEPSKSLFWLTGGFVEWRSLENYNRPWCDCYIDFQEEFGTLLVNIVKKSQNLSEIRDGFNKYLNLPILYDFAISKKLIK
jgi:hypothetical protein